MKRMIGIWFVVLVTMSLMVQNASSVIIIRNFLGGTPPTNSIGGGNIEVCVNLVADEFELMYPGDDYTLIVDYEWYPNGGATHELIEQGGTPNRETHARIRFNNDGIDGHFSWDIDPAPWLNKGQTNVYEEWVEGLGGGIINASRMYVWNTNQWNPTDSHCDFMSTVRHEFGHAIGPSYGNWSFQDQSVDRSIHITNGLYAGMVLPLKTNYYGVVSHIAQIAPTGLTLMSSEVGTGGRNTMSQADLALDGFLSQITNINWDLIPSLKVSSTTITNRIQGHKVITPGMKLTWLQPIGQWAVQQSTNLLTWVTLTNVPSFTTNGWANISVPALGANNLFRLIRTDTPICTTNSYPSLQVQ